MLLGYSPKGTIGLYGGICFAAALAISLLPIETKGRKMLVSMKQRRKREGGRKEGTRTEKGISSSKFHELCFSFLDF